MYGAAALRVYDNDNASIATHYIVVRNGAPDERLAIWSNSINAAHRQLWVRSAGLEACLSLPV